MTPAVFILAPLLTAAVLLAAGRRLPVAVHAWLAILVMAVCTALSVGQALHVCSSSEAQPLLSHLATWLILPGPHGPLTLNLGLWVDPLAALMTVVVCLLATLVLVFTTWYLHGDRFERRFYWMFTFFCAAMLTVVLSDNLLLSFIGWELVGLGSYFLIGYWFDKPAAADDAHYQAMKAPGACGVIESRLSPAHAQLKAFVMNRVGDFGFLSAVAIVTWVAWAAGAASLRWDEVFSLVRDGAFDRVSFAGLSGTTLLTLAGLGILLGAIGKSAQFPLHTWLPDAMQGPTTASAIIHAATMVAAGVYLIARCYPMLTPDVLLTVQWIGAITCFLAATIACVQWDLKAVLAYSTISQLGFMLLGLGSGGDTGGYTAGISHLFTHAIFKCLLFLCAAAVIHACHEQQNLHRLGGLRRKMPFTALAAGLAVLAICGMPFFSGFYSKDAVLAAAWVAAQDGRWQHVVPLGLGLVTALLTAAYMTRWWLRLFAGTPRDVHAVDHAHDPWPRATVVLLLLALGTFQVVFTFNANPLASGPLDTLLTAPGPAAGHEMIELRHHAHGTVALLATVLMAIGMSFSILVFWWLPERRRIDAPGALARGFQPVWRFLAELWWLDKLYDRAVVNGLGQGIGRLLARLDLGSAERLAKLDAAPTGPATPTRLMTLISLDSLVDGVGRSVAALGRASVAAQNGRIGAYAAYACLAIAVVLVLLLLT